MFEKFFRYLRGYVVLELSGGEIDLEKIRKSGALLKNVTSTGGKTVFEVSAKDLYKIADLGIDFAVKKSCGGRFFLKKALGHPVLIVGILLMALVVYIGSSFIWTVEYEGVSERNLEQVISASEKAGVRVGAYKKRMMTPLEIKDIILANTDGISWCWVYIKGSRAVVDVREHSIPPVIFNPDTPCDLVAGKDAVIQSITSQRGKRMKKSGETVSAGDVVISGRVEFGEDEGYFAHARGRCIARTSYQKEGIYKLYQNYKTYTGKGRNFLKLKLFSLEIPLHFGKVDFPYCDKVEKVYEISLGKENYIGLGLEKVSFFEYNIKKEPISRELCAQLAKAELEEMIAKELYPDAQKVSEELAVDIIDEETISVRLMMEFDENIAVEKIIEEVTFFEPKTD